MTNQFEVIARWRKYEEALCSDLIKAYYSIKTGELEMHIRSVVWRFGNINEKWKHFGYKTISYGDTPAGVYLDIAIYKTADMFKNIDLAASKRIENDRFVDDLATGGSGAVVRKLKGKDVNETFTTNGTLA